MDQILFPILQLFTALVVFAVLAYVGKFLFNKVKNSSYSKSSKLFNLKEYLPYEQVTEIHQIYYLMMIVIFSLNILYLIYYWKGNLTAFIAFDILVSIYLAKNIDMGSFKNKLLLFLLVPFNSICVLIFGDSQIFFMHYLHVLVFFYFIKVYYDKFMDYSETNSLGIAIMLLFLIVFISFLFTIPVENVSPLNSLVMVSNAFTSNGYTILGSTDLGKINSLVLVWSGFILSGVGSATLAVSIMMRHINGKFDELEESVKNNRKNK